MQLLTPRLFGFFPFGGLFAGTGWATAAPARLEYSAPPSCPTEDAFVARVTARGASFAGPAETDAVIAVSISKDAAEFSGAVALRDASGSSATREVHSVSCEEVADGLAVVVAIALQGKSSDDSSASSPSTPPSEPVPVPASKSPASKGTSPKPAGSRRLRTLGQFGDETLKVSTGELGVRSEVAVTAAGGVMLGLVPSTPVPRFDLTLVRTNFITTPEDQGYIVGGILRVRWTLLAPVHHEVSGYATDIWAAKAGISGCSQFVYDRDGLVLLGCGEIAAGTASVLTKDPAGTTTQDELQGIGTAGLELSARYNFSSHFHLELSVGGEAWLARLNAKRADGSEIFRTNPFAGYATLGLGLHF